MEIIAVDPTCDTLARDWHRVYERSIRHEREHPAPWAYDEIAAELREPGRRRTLLAFAGLDRGEVVAAGALSLPRLDNTDSAVVSVDTDPTRRRCGHGGAMVAHLEARAADDGRTLLNAESNYPYSFPTDGVGHAYADFLTRRGYVFGLGDVHRRATLPLDVTLLERLAATSAPHHPAYTIRSWRGAVPEDLVASFAIVNASLPSEAPTGDVQREPELADVAALREEERLRTAQGRAPYTTVALDDRGEVVAYTTLMTSAHDPGRCHQWGTVVARRHRGHRLGTALKAANHHLAQTHDPGLREVFTYNAEVNPHMSAINDALGFVPVERLGEFQKRLA